jgi:hypothetical protein
MQVPGSGLEVMGWQIIYYLLRLAPSALGTLLNRFRWRRLYYFTRRKLLLQE